MSTSIQEGASSSSESLPAPKIADPLPLGIAGFAMTTFVLSLANADVYPAALQSTLGLAIFYGGLAQLLAGMWEFRRGSTFGAAAFSSYGAFWLSFWYLVVHVLPGVHSASAAATLLGTYLLGWAIFTCYMAVAALRVTGAVFTVFVLLSITYALLTVGAYATAATWTHWGGYFGIATAVAAWYAAFDAVTAATFGHRVLPAIPLPELPKPGGHRPAVQV